MLISINKCTMYINKPMCTQENKVMQIKSARKPYINCICDVFLIELIVLDK